jgi:N-acetylglucosaminyldiphosphoundecaprenol N-acetyl-beta-D-mannosaminyltransferase
VKVCCLSSRDRVNGRHKRPLGERRTRIAGTEVALADRVMIGRVPVDLVNSREFVDTAAVWAVQGKRASIVCVNAYLVNLCARNPAMATAVARADMHLPDGHSVVLAAGLNRYAHQGRVAITHMHADMAAAWVAAGLRVFLWGSRPGVAARAAQRLRTEFGLDIVGVRDGYTGGTDQDIVAEVNASGAHILFIGLGSPKQEIWLDAHRDELKPVALTCGGWLDWTAGVRKPCPEWIYRFGLEWAYRLAQEPRRLFKRYVIGNPTFLLRVLLSTRHDRRETARMLAHVPLPRFSETVEPYGPHPSLDLPPVGSAPHADVVPRSSAGPAMWSPSEPPHDDAVRAVGRAAVPPSRR